MNKETPLDRISRLKIYDDDDDDHVFFFLSRLFHNVLLQAGNQYLRRNSESLVLFQFWPFPALINRRYAKDPPRILVAKQSQNRRCQGFQICSQRIVVKVVVVEVTFCWF